MYRAGLLAVLLLAVAVLAGNVTLTCTVESSRTVDTTGSISVGFYFTSIAPVFSGSGLVGYTRSYAYLYQAVSSVQWDGPLEFKVTLEHYAPNQHWRIERYRCVYNRSGNVQVRYYHVVAQTPERRTTTITFTVPATAARHSESTSVPVSRPLEGTYCSAPPTVNSWPNCPAFQPDPNKVSVVYPRSWQALQVNGRRPGDVVEAYGVNATIPDPWVYSLEPVNMDTLSFVRIDGSNVYKPEDAKGVPVSSSVYFYAVGMPQQWGVVKARGAQAPLYVVKPVVSRQPPTAFCRPPTCIVLTWVNLTIQCVGTWRTMYAGIVAVQSGITMKENVVFALDHFNSPSLGTELRLPFGSVFKPVAHVWWVLEGWNVDVDGVARLRVINNPAYYESIAKKGKINGPLFTAGWGTSSTSEIAVAVDHSAQLIELSWYAWPLPWHTSQSGPLKAVNWLLYVDVCDSGVGIPVALDASTWIADALTRNYPEISRNRRLDLLHYLYSEPVVYYWGRGDQHGTVGVRTTPYYASTTADAAGQIKLYYTSGIEPTDATAMVIPSTPQSVGGGSGGGGGGGDDCVDCSVSYWLVSLVPTAACRSMFCTSLSPELLGPVPSFAGDRALPNMGYSIMLMYVGETGRRRVKVYVEDGYVITSRQSINVARVQNYRLVEIDKEWRPLEAVVVGPGWWVPYRQLDACGSMPVRASSIYATPDRTGFFKIIVEDNGRNSTYVFRVTNDVGYRISVRTPAPASITATSFNITVYVTLGGVPYFHAVYGYGEGGRLSPPACASTWFNNTYLASQLVLSGDFWGSFGLAHMPLKPVNIQYIYTKPRIELVEPWRGLVKVKADGPVAGFAFYAQRGGTWVKIGEAAGSCLLVNASRLFPWDPVLVLPLVEQVLDAAPGSTVAIWRPETVLLFKTWADVVGYPKGARSVLEVVRRC